MLQVTVTMTNDQAEALATVMPEVLSEIMDKVIERDEENEGPTGERIDDLTKTRAVLGDVLSRTLAHVDTVARLEREDAAARAKARADRHQRRAK